MAKVWTRIRQTIERHGSAALRGRRGRLGAARERRPHRLAVGRRIFRLDRRRPPRRLWRRAPLAAGRGEAQFRDWPLGLNLGQWLPI
jgi:hypothetical protein